MCIVFFRNVHHIMHLPAKLGDTADARWKSSFSNISIPINHTSNRQENRSLVSPTRNNRESVLKRLIRNGANMASVQRGLLCVLFEIALEMRSGFVTKKIDFLYV